MERCMSRKILREITDNSASKNEEIRAYINRIAGHEDVQTLMDQTHERLSECGKFGCAFKRRWTI